MLLYFSAPWCGPCRTFGPIVDKITTDLAIPVKKINIDEDTNTAWRYRVMSIPTLIVVDADEKAIKQYPGAMNEELLRLWLDDYHKITQ